MRPRRGIREQSSGGHSSGATSFAQSLLRVSGSSHVLRARQECSRVSRTTDRPTRGRNLGARVNAHGTFPAWAVALLRTMGTMWRRGGAATGSRCERQAGVASATACPGLPAKLVEAARGSERLSAASSARSARLNLGRAACRRRIAISWRAVAVRAVRRARTGSARRDTRTTRARSPSSTTTEQRT